MDISQLSEKERNKILNQRTRDATKAKNKVDKEAHKVKDKVEKVTKKAPKSGKSKASTLPFLLTETSYTSPLKNPYKQDVSTA